MTINVFQRLRDLLPPSPVLIAEVVEHHADDTSTVRLPSGLGQAPQQGGVAIGALVRVRGTTVPVGSNAFIRDGVIETQAPDGEPIEIVIGTVSECADGLPPIAFSGPVPDQELTVGAAFELALAGYFSGGYPTYAYSVVGTLPAGLVLDAVDGVISGTPTEGVTESVVVRVTDATGAIASTNAFVLDVVDGFVERFAQGDLSLYSTVSGTTSVFSFEDVSPFGTAIVIAPYDGPNVAIERAFSVVEAQSLRFRVRLDAVQNDDGASIDFRAGGASYLFFTAARESAFDALRRPRLFKSGNNWAVYPSQFIVGRWYEVLVENDAGNAVCTVTDTVTEAAVQTAVGLWGAPEISALRFSLDSASVGFTTSGASYSDVAVAP